VAGKNADGSKAITDFEVIKFGILCKTTNFDSKVSMNGKVDIIYGSRERS